MADAAAKKDANPAKATPAPAAVAAAAAAADPNAPQKPKRDLLNVIILGVACVNLLMVAGLGVFVSKMAGKVHELQVRAAQPPPVDPDAEHEDPKAKEKAIGKELQPSVQGTLYPMESFLVNISSEQGTKFLQTQMELELSDPSLEDEVTRKKAALRDTVIVLLSSRNYKELREADGMKGLRSDILKAMNALLSTGKIKEIYFTQFHFN